MKKFQPVLDIFYIILIYAWLCFNIIVLHQILSESDVSIPTVIVAANNILFIVLYVILIRVQIINILEAIKTEDIDYCLNNYFFYKYTLMPIMLIGRGLPVFICLFGVGAFFFGSFNTVCHYYLAIYNWYVDFTTCTAGMHNCNRVAMFYINYLYFGHYKEEKEDDF